MAATGTIKVRIRGDAELVSLRLTVTALRMQLRQEIKDRVAAERSKRITENAMGLLIGATRSVGREQEGEIEGLRLSLADMRAAYLQTTRELSERMLENDQIRAERDAARRALATCVTHSGPVHIHLPPAPKETR